MKTRNMISSAALAMMLVAAPAYAAKGEFDADKMLSELEKQIDLSGDAMSKMKPALDAKSAELKKSINNKLEFHGLQGAKDVTQSCRVCATSGNAHVPEDDKVETPAPLSARLRSS